MWGHYFQYKNIGTLEGGKRVEVLVHGEFMSWSDPHDLAYEALE